MDAPDPDIQEDAEVETEKDPAIDTEFDADLEEMDEPHPIEIEVRRIESEQFENEVIPAIRELRENMTDEDEEDDFLERVVPQILEDTPGDLELNLQDWTQFVVMLNAPSVRSDVGAQRLDYIEGKITKRLMRTEYEAAQERQ